MMKNQTKKSFFLYIKKPLNAACYDRCCLICLILMFFVFCWGDEGRGGGWGAGTEGLGGPFPVGWAPCQHHSGPPYLGSRERTSNSVGPFLPGLGGRGVDAVTLPLGFQGGVGVASSTRPGAPTEEVTHTPGHGWVAPGRGLRAGEGEDGGGQGEPAGQPPAGFLEALGWGGLSLGTSSLPEGPKVPAHAGPH